MDDDRGMPPEISDRWAKLVRLQRWVTEYGDMR